MGDTTKLTLSGKQLSLVKDTEWIFTKQLIIEKVYALFGNCIPEIRDKILTIGAVVPPEVISSVPKIYKGESYLQLPYVMLDYPRCFNGADIFAIRTMFWWGNFFSITLHLSGKYKSDLEQKLTVAKLSGDFFIGINDDQWAHHFMESNYVAANNFTELQRTEVLLQKPFLKLALKFNLDDWNKMNVQLMEGYGKVAALLA